MEEKRENQEEFKHVCKLCNKRYPSGKSLGGHMRSHVIANSYVSPNKLKSKKAPIFEAKYNGDHLQACSNGDLGVLGSSTYGLRENPKKTWRASEDSSPIAVKQMRVCKQCGKAFQSLKALCGHMSCHSDKERKFSRLNGYDDDEEEEEEDEDEDDDEDDDEDEDELWESEEEKEVAMESHSDNNGRRSSGKEARYKAISVVDSLNSYGNGCSSNVSEIEHEQEEVAICLMMLSRDSGHHKVAAVNFTTESSDNNSVILEGGSASAYVTNNRHCLNNVSNDDKNGSNVPLKMKQEASKEMKCAGMDNSDSGYFENGAKELDSDDSVDWYAKNYVFNKPKFKFGSGYGDVYDSEFGKAAKKSGSGYLEKAPYMVAEDEHEEPDQTHLKRLLRSRDGGSKKTKHEFLSSSQATTKVSNHKAGKYECWICQRSFKTHQALGGHIITHRRNNNGSRHENNDHGHSLETSKSGSKPEPSFVIKTSAAKNAANLSKKTKGHKCPFCPKVFRSGQALGGHKRSHLIGCSPQDRANLIQSAERNSPENNHQFLDLNLPAPVEEDGGGGGGGGGSNQSQFIPW